MDGDMKYPFDVDEVLFWLGGFPAAVLLCSLEELWLVQFTSTFIFPHNIIISYV